MTKKQTKTKQGRPRSLAPKSKRYMVRVTEGQLLAFEHFAKKRGFGSAGAWMIFLGDQEIRNAEEGTAP